MSITCREFRRALTVALGGPSGRRRHEASFPPPPGAHRRCLCEREPENRPETHLLHLEAGNPYVCTPRKPSDHDGVPIPKRCFISLERNRSSSSPSVKPAPSGSRAARCSLRINVLVPAMAPCPPGRSLIAIPSHIVLEPVSASNNLARRSTIHDPRPTIHDQRFTLHPPPPCVPPCPQLG